jgi:hypothetical protein
MSFTFSGGVMKSINVFKSLDGFRCHQSAGPGFKVPNKSGSHFITLLNQVGGHASALYISDINHTSPTPIPIPAPRAQDCTKMVQKGGQGGIERMLAFLAYNHADVEIARTLGAQLKIVGADVWIDQWQIQAGDSIVHQLDAGLAGFDTFILLWSQRAAKSNWVRKELEVAIQRGIEDDRVRIIPVRLDETALPILLHPLKRVDIFDAHQIRDAVCDIMGFATERARIRAIQSVLESAQIEINFVYGYGPIAGCPRCGAGLESIESWNQFDEEHEDSYAGARCKECGWNDGGEV